jgi:putative colanic acid biosynthesis UDP-glucose lipid carrier transferase
MITWRGLLRTALSNLRIRGYNTRRAAVIGTGTMAQHIQELLEKNPGGGFRFVGCYSDEAQQDGVSGQIDDLVQAAMEGQVDHVYLVASATDEATIARVVQLFSNTTINLFVVPGLWVFELLHSRWSLLGDLPVISIYDVPVYGVNSLAKRVFDLLAGIGFLLLAAIPMLIIGVLIKATSLGPVFFKQRRYGLDGREILVWKFRTMMCAEDGDVIQQARQDDDRITPVGRWLRRTSLDELPQLFNVLAGDMSLVGPRPHAVAHNEQYRKLIRGYMLRHKIKPGITGLAQVHGFRGLTDTLDKMEKRIQYDLEYIRTWSLLLDLRILMRTLTTVFRAPYAH